MAKQSRLSCTKKQAERPEKNEPLRTKRKEGKNMYYITDYFTNEIIDVVDSFKAAKAICDAYDGSQVETDTNEILYSNITLPF